MSTLAEPLVPSRPKTAAALRPWIEVSANLDPRCGGVSSVMSPLCQAIREAGCYDTSLAAFCRPDEDLQFVTPGMRSVERYRLAALPGLSDNSVRDRLARQIAEADGIHIHGLWQEHSRLAAGLAQSLRKPYLVSAHGMLDPWALKHKRLKKFVYLRLIERATLEGAACLHALSSSEAEDYRRLAPGVPIAVIPNGVSVPDHADPELILDRFPGLRGKRLVLFLSRIHHKKGLDILYRAWSEVSRSWPEAHLVLAGPDVEGTQASLEHAIAKLGISDRVTFTGMLQGALKWSALAACKLFVLPSYSEGLSMAVLEALGMSRPVLITKECHVDGVSEWGCGWEIQPNQEELTHALHAFLSASPELVREMGDNGRNLVQSSYSWYRIGQQMSSLYNWMATGNGREHVKLV